jgi:putative hemolysin
MALVLLNAFFAASEIALLSLNDNKIRMKAESGNRRARLLVDLTGEPGSFLATIQIGITLAGFLASAFASESFSDPIARAIVAAGAPVSENLIKTVSMIVITFILSYFTLVLGELVPKRLAMKKPEPIAMFAARPLYVLSKAASPFVKLLTLSTNLVIRLFGIDPHANDDQATEEEIRLLVEAGGEKGNIKKAEKEMINNIFEFNDKNVSAIMTHRTKISALPADASLEEVTAYIASEKFTRIPVYREDLDNIIGILHTKHLVKYLADSHYQSGINQSDFNLSAIIMEPYSVPETKRIDRLFREMNQHKVHLAVVIDEYGGTAGIVTIEDVVEEIVGNIYDEYDVIDNDIERFGDTSFLIKGYVSLTDVQKVIDIDFPDGEYETLGGFVIGQLGRIPRAGEHPSIEFSDYRMTVSHMAGKSIDSIKVVRIIN